MSDSRNYVCIKFRGSLLMSNMAGADSITPPTSNLASRAAALVSNYLDFFNLIKTKKMKPPMLQGKLFMAHKVGLLCRYDTNGCYSI